MAEFPLEGHGSVVRWRPPPLVLLLVACNAAPPSHQAEPAPPSQPALGSEVSAARASLRSLRERPLAKPRRYREQRCESASFAGLSKSERELWLRVIDARLDTRHVLPLRITGHLTEPDLNELDSVLAGIEQPEARAESVRQVESVSRKRFVGAFHVIHYVSPKWVVRAGHAKPSWDAGRLDAWLVLHDARSGETLCATRMTVIGDATGAPRAVRLRSETREQMQTALGERLRRATPAALERLGADLELPAEARVALRDR